MLRGGIYDDVVLTWKPSFNSVIFVIQLFEGC